MSEICIYCEGQGPFNKEHLLPRALGGSLTDTFVCVACNGTLGRVDQALAEDLIVSHARTALTQTTAFAVHLAGAHIYNGPDGVVHHVRVGNQLHPEVMPQIEVQEFEEKSVRFAFRASSTEGRDRLCTFLESRHPSGYRRLRHRLGGNHAGGGPSLVMHRSDDAFVSAATEAGAERLVKLLETDGLKLAASLRASQVGSSQMVHPTIYSHMSHRPNEVGRGIAKIAFNLLAHTLGRFEVLRPSFNPIRKYVLGDLHLPNATGTGVPYDSRFVLPRYHQEEAQWTPPGALHAVVVGAYEGRYIAFVELYRSAHFIVFTGGECSGPFNPRCYAFSGDRQASRVLTPVEFYKAIMHRRAGGRA